jgi:hypothetical protein
MPERVCNTCDYKTNIKSHFDKHCESKKHYKLILKCFDCQNNINESLHIISMNATLIIFLMISQMMLKILLKVCLNLFAMYANTKLITNYHLMNM